VTRPRRAYAANKYSICYVEAGAQDEPDASHFAAADYGNGASQYQMQGYPGEFWYDTRGFAAYKYGDSNSVLTGAAANIAAGMAPRIAGCKAEGQDAIEPDDLDGYTNQSNSGAAGGGWGLTQQDAPDYEHTPGFPVPPSGEISSRPPTGHGRDLRPSSCTPGSGAPLGTARR
jgi:hypothetical protein